MPQVCPSIVFCVGTEELRIRLAQRLPGIIFLMVRGSYFVVRQSGWHALPAQDLADEIRVIIGGIHRRNLVVVDNYDTILYGHWWIILNGIYDLMSLKLRVTLYFAGTAKCPGFACISILPRMIATTNCKRNQKFKSGKTSCSQ